MWSKCNINIGGCLWLFKTKAESAVIERGVNCLPLYQYISLKNLVERGITSFIGTSSLIAR